MSETPRTYVPYWDWKEKSKQTEYTEATPLLASDGTLLAKGWARHISHPSSPAPGHSPTSPRIRNQLPHTPRPGSSGQPREPLTCFCSPPWPWELQ